MKTTSEKIETAGLIILLLVCLVTAVVTFHGSNAKIETTSFPRTAAYLGEIGKRDPTHAEQVHADSLLSQDVAANHRQLESDVRKNAVLTRIDYAILAVAGIYLLARCTLLGFWLAAFIPSRKIKAAGVILLALVGLATAVTFQILLDQNANRAKWVSVTAFIDGKSGSDATGIVGRRDKPFATAGVLLTHPEVEHLFFLGEDNEREQEKDLDRNQWKLDHNATNQ